MSASDAIHPMIRVFHSSRRSDPPHELPYWASGVQGNNHPDIIHAGTRQAATERRGRDFLHIYEITPGEEYPVTFGDEDTESNTYESPVMATKLRGTQPGLFETISGNPDIAIKSNRAVPYRNAAEDKGSVSYMIPKGAIGKTVKYVGLDPDWSKEG
jgi:hypothetical protein